MATSVAPLHSNLEVFLQPGDTRVGDRSMRLRTLLGSCVAVTLWHPGLRVGGMCHFLLPARLRGYGLPLDGRYGDEALAILFAGLELRGASAYRCEAMIAGGGAMFPGEHSTGQLSVGERNGEAARAMLREKGVFVRKEHLYGKGHRVVAFDVNTGQVDVRHMPLSQANHRSYVSVAL